MNGHCEAPLVPTARLALRRFRVGDEAEVVRLHEDERLRALLVDDHPLHQPDVAARFLARLQSFYLERPGLGIWHASERHDDGTLGGIGWFSLMPLTDHAGEVELGSRLAPAAWGRGLAMDGCEALVAHALESLRLPRLWGTCHPANQGARLCLLALGFMACGAAAYEGGQALYHRLDGARWAVWRAQPRRWRLRQASAALRAATASSAAQPETSHA